MISLCNYCDRHTPADGSKWILNDLNKVEYQETPGKAMTVWRQWTHMVHLCLNRACNVASDPSVTLAAPGCITLDAGFSSINVPV